MLLLFRGKLLMLRWISNPSFGPQRWLGTLCLFGLKYSSGPLYFTLIHLLQPCLCVFLLALIWRIFQSSNYEEHNWSLNSCCETFEKRQCNLSLLLAGHFIFPSIKFSLRKVSPPDGLPLEGGELNLLFKELGFEESMSAPNIESDFQCHS